MTDDDDTPIMAALGDLIESSPAIQELLTGYIRQAFERGRRKGEREGQRAGQMDMERIASRFAGEAHDH